MKCFRSRRVIEAICTVAIIFAIAGTVSGLVPSTEPLPFYRPKPPDPLAYDGISSSVTDTSWVLMGYPENLRGASLQGHCYRWPSF